MLALRLMRGARPLTLCRRVLLCVVSAGTSLLLLTTLGYATTDAAAVGHARVRLLWCLVPLAATGWLAVSVARADPAAHARSGMTAAGLGTVRTTALAAVSTLLTCLLGNLIALLAFLAARGDLGLRPGLTGPVTRQLGVGHPLPLAAALTLLSLVPLSAAAGVAVSLRPGRNLPPVPAASVRQHAPTLTHSGLPWGVALTAAGLMLVAYGSHTDIASLPSLPLPAGILPGSPLALLGWALSATGLALVGPGLTQLCGRALSVGSPGFVRLLSGRLLQEEYRTLGGPLGVVCAVTACTYAAALLHGGTAGKPLGPSTLLGTALVLACVTLSGLTAVLQVRAARASATTTLRQMGVSGLRLHGAAALRTAALLVVLAPVTWAVARLAAAPLTHR
ncbi:hypothetical protein ACFV3R_05090 [Streptomyces sp. NPDC059740]|uniref:hypothetical protein n=1 Tax=Streptomyces sp. NPDC059740 TaxID=3346926 RepID=UPI0036691891